MVNTTNKTNHAKTTNNVRQLGSSANNNTHQNQILSALDTLGAKLVRSESERETMRKLLNEALDTQEKLENQLERSQINILRRLDLVEDRETGLSEEDKDFIQKQRAEVESTRQDIDENTSRQKALEDKLRDANQTITKLQRRLDSQEQKRVKLQRRIERVENMVADAQNALEAKAMVLLTDQSEAYRALPHTSYIERENNIDISNQMNTLHQSQTGKAEIVEETKRNDQLRTSNSRGKIFVFVKNRTAMYIVSAILCGWVLAGIFDGENYDTQPLSTANQLANRELATNPDDANASDALVNIEEDIALLAAQMATEEFLQTALQDMGISDNDNTAIGESDEFAIISSNITIDRDLSLPGEIKELEEKAFEQVAEAQHDLAALYVSGQAGVTQNYKRAIIWFRQAADQNIANAAYNLGVLYQQGLGQPQDLQRALDWYRRAALLNHPEAQYNLGIAYIEGVGTRYNPAMAAAYFQRAAFAGIVEAAYNLGLILENGLLGETRPQDALKWYRGAAERGNRDAAQSFKTLSESLNLDSAEAGLLSNGESLASYINPLQAIEPAAGLNDIGANEAVKQDVSLGALLPDENQLMIAQIQEQLRKAGLYTGPQDGIIGSGTISAIRTYQKDQGLTVDGDASIALLTYMLRQGTL